MSYLTVTLQDLKNKLSSILAQKTTRRYSLEDRDRALEVAYLKICASENFSFLETRSSNIAITASTNTFALPTDYLRFDKRSQGFYLTSKKPNNLISFLERPDRKFTDETEVKKPEYWYKVNTTGYLSALSDASYTAILEYFKKPETIASSGVIIIPPSEADIIAWGAALELLSTTNPKRPGVEGEYINRLNELIDRYVTKDEDFRQDYIVNNNWL